MGSSTPPWRSLDSTPPSPDPAAAAPAHDGGATDPLGAIPGRVILLGGGAVLCAALAIVIALTSASGGDLVVDGGAGLPVGSGPVTSEFAGIATGEVVVEVVGAVVRPGVYRLPSGSRVGDAVAAAGGYGPRVDTARTSRELNLAAPLDDGGQIHVASRDESPPDGPSGQPGAATPPSSGGSALLDLNQATAAELDTLPGIGPVTAEKIIAARAEAPFAAVEDLRTRGLVGEKTFERIRASLVVR